MMNSGSILAEDSGYPAEATRPKQWHADCSARDIHERSTAAAVLSHYCGRRSCRHSSAIKILASFGNSTSSHGSHSPESNGLLSSVYYPPCLAGDTALHVAAAALQPSICRLLLASGANVAARNRRGCEPLHYAAENSHAMPQSQTATIRTLLAAGADVDATNMDGATPLHKAVRARSVAAVKALIEGAADIHKPNGSGSTPWDLTLQSTGRSGSGTLEAHSARRRIQQILGKPGAVSES